MLLHAPLLGPSGAAVRGTMPRELLQAAPSAAAPRTGVGEERSSSRTEGRTWPPTAPTCSTHGTLALLHALLFEPSDDAVRGR